MGLIQYLKTDEELKELRSRWKEMYSAPFPPYNWDEYDGIEDYKTQIRNKLNDTTGQQAGGIFKLIEKAAYLVVGGLMISKNLNLK